METIDTIYFAMDARFAFWLLGAVLGFAVGMSFGVFIMAGLRLAAAADDDMDTTMDHAGYESARPNLVVHDMTKGGRIV